MLVVTALVMLRYCRRFACWRRRQPVSWLGGMLGAILLIASTAIGENWPGWRGPRGDGTSLESDLPTQWDGTTQQGIAWKVPLPGTGHSSPVVWEDRIFVTAFVEEDQARLLLCLDARDGHIHWQCRVLQSPPEIKHALNSYASGTPVTDGEAIYVSFLETDGREEPARNVDKPKPMTPGHMVVAAIDMSGQVLWRKQPTGFSSAHGFCTSPVLYQNLLIVNGDHDGDSSILGLDRHTGETVWRFPRVHQTRSYCTPIIRPIAGQPHLVFSGSKQVVSLDPRNGTLRWYVDGPTQQFVASMVYDGEKFYLAAGFPDHHVMAIRPDGQGDVTQTHVAWDSTDAKCYVPSPVLAAGQLFVADDRGTINCFDPVSGKRWWRDRLGGHYSASLVAAGALVYCTADDGTVRVLRAGGDAMEIVGTNPLGENCFASPALAGGRIYLRGEQHLFAIEK